MSQFYFLLGLSISIMWNLLKFGTMVEWKLRSGDFLRHFIGRTMSVGLNLFSLAFAAFLNTMTCGLWRISPPEITHQVAKGVKPADKPIEDVKIGYHFFSEMINRTVLGHLRPFWDRIRSFWGQNDKKNQYQNVLFGDKYASGNSILQYMAVIIYHS